MKSYRNAARIAGALFLIAMASSIIGGVMVGSEISAFDGVVSNKPRMITGVFLEMVNVLSVMGIAIVLFPVLKNYKGWLSLGYLSFRTLEAICCLALVFYPVGLLWLGQDPDTSTQGTITFLKGLRLHMMELWIPIFVALSAFLLYYAMFYTRLVPRFISIWGFLAVALMLTFNLLTVDMDLGLFFVLPIILVEIFLGIWLIVKGFNNKIITSWS